MAADVSLLRVNRYWHNLGRAAWKIRGPRFTEETSNPKLKLKLQLKKQLRRLEGQLLLLKADEKADPEKLKFLLRYVRKLRRVLR